MSDIAAAPLLLQGDCMELLSTLPEHSVDFVCCDPPFGLTEIEWDKALGWTSLWPELKRVLKPTGVTAIFTSGKFTFDTWSSNAKDYKYKWIWVKTQGTDFLNARRRPMTCTEEVLVFYQGKTKDTWYEPQMSYGHKPATRIRSPHEKVPRHYEGEGRSKIASHVDYINDGSRYPTNVLRYNRVNTSERIHPSQKPVELIAHLVKSHCPMGGVVLDFCMGSGSTGVAAVSAGRRFIGIEKDPGYFELASNAVNSAYSSTELQ